jgi:hypothetical protein
MCRARRALRPGNVDRRAPVKGGACVILARYLCDAIPVFCDSVTVEYFVVSALHML